MPGKVRVQELPLINCYVFVHITKSQYVPVLETESVLKFTKIANNLLSIPEKEIETLKRVVGESNLELTAEPTAWSMGDPVEITAGNLIGLKGRLVSVEGKKQMIVDLNTLGYSLRMNIDASLLRRLK